jgi:hypothetical protein
VDNRSREWVASPQKWRGSLSPFLLMSRQGARGSSTEWKKLREACFSVWGRTCNYCGEVATQVDHIIELAIGGTNTLDNLQPLCKPCHTAKTVRFNKKRVKTSKEDRGVFWTESRPTDSLSPFSPRMVRLDPPMAETPKD